MLCIASVRHVSPLGPDFTRAHVVVVTADRSANDCVQQLGASLPVDVAPCIKAAGNVQRISYGSSNPVAHDPDHIIVHVGGIPGGVYVHVPYRCTPANLMDHVVPDKLRRLGVHPFDVHGAAYVGDKLASVADYWRVDPPELTWTKLRVPVSCTLPPRVIRGIRGLQRAWRRRPVFVLVQ